VSNSTFKLKIVTPLKITENDIKYIRLKDATGFLGIMKGHIDFLTVIEPSLCYYIDSNDREIFLAINGGVLRIKGGKVTLTSLEVFESDDAEKLSEIIEGTVAKRDKSETDFHKTLEGIEKSFIEKTLELVRGNP
jgi:F-type H+-transporting ATPase subunit epsilon